MTTKLLNTPENLLTTFLCDCGSTYVRVTGTLPILVVFHLIAARQSGVRRRRTTNDTTTADACFFMATSLLWRGGLDVRCAYLDRYSGRDISHIKVAYHGVRHVKLYRPGGGAAS